MSKRNTETHSPGDRDPKHQLFLPTGELFNQDKYDDLEKWLTRGANQTTFDRALVNLDKLKLKGKRYCSTARLTAFLRDHSVQTDPEFRLNDHIVPYLKRRIVFLRPDLHLFELRLPPKANITSPNARSAGSGSSARRS